MKKTRKIIAIILCFCVALSLSSIVAGVTIKNTVFNADFVAKNLITAELQEECEKQLKLKFNVLEEKSNIPTRVFKKIIEDKPIDQTMKLNVSNFFIDRDTSLNSEDNIKYFYDKCVEYLDENGAQYNEADIRNTAIEATRLYSESVGFNNVEHLKLYTDQTKQEINQAISMSMIYLFISLILLYAMYRKPFEAMKLMSQSVIATGFSGVAVSIASVILGYGMNLPISPEAYMNAFNELAKMGYLVFSLVSLSVMLVGIILTLSVNKIIKRNENRESFRFAKRIDTI